MINRNNFEISCLDKEEKAFVDLRKTIKLDSIKTSKTKILAQFTFGTKSFAFSLEKNENAVSVSSTFCKQITQKKGNDIGPSFRLLGNEKLQKFKEECKINDWTCINDLKGRKIR